MEYVQGAADLGDYLNARHAQDTLDEAVVIRILREVVDALAACHEANIVHADVKPGNIMVGTDGRVRLVDFGFAKSIGQLDAEGRDGDSYGSAINATCTRSYSRS